MRQNYLFVLRGVPASGKSTYAKRWVAEDTHNRVRVNRDDLRFSTYGMYQLDPALEHVITKAEHALIGAYLAAGKTVVVDNMNLRPKYVKEYLRLAAKHSTFVLHKDFTVDVEVALERNRNRERQVPEETILMMYRKYVVNGNLPEFPELDTTETYIPDELLPETVLVDIDGTAMLFDGTREAYDWDKVIDDTPNLPVLRTVQALHDSGHTIVYLSGRDETAREDTLISLTAAGYPVENSQLYMRPAGDRRKDTVVKLELFNTHIRHQYQVLFVLDDRDTVVDLYRLDLQIPAFQVGYGGF